MQRPLIRIEVKGSDGYILRVEERRAWNAAIRATEAVVRETARDAGEYFNGSLPTREGDRYSRLWRGEKSGRILWAYVTKLES
jgi:hypothetical protein